MFADQTVYDFAHIGQRELLIGRGRQAATPGIEDLHRLGAGQDLAVEVAGNRLGQLVQQGVHRLRVFVEHRLGFAEVLRGAAFDHVGRQGPRASGETDQRYAAVEFAANGTHRVHHVAQILLRIGNR